MDIYNSNKQIVNQLYNLINFYEKQKKALKENPSEAKKYQFKISSFKKGLEQIKNYKYMILSSQDISSLPGIGKGIIQRVEEILENGKLSEIEGIQIIKQDKNDEIDKLKRITGVGPVNAKKMVDNNISLEKLLNEMKNLNNDIDKIQNSSCLSLLTHHQLIGLKYFHDIELRIPRKEIEDFNYKLNMIIDDMSIDNIIFKICGSFRRGNSDSGDIDILISNPELSNLQIINEKKILNKLVTKLINEGIIIDNLTNEGNTKYMGICKLNDNTPARRIDIRCVPFNSFIPSLL